MMLRFYFADRVPACGYITSLVKEYLETFNSSIYEHVGSTRELAISLSALLASQRDADAAHS
jgi:hypothetical protein